MYSFLAAEAGGPRHSLHGGAHHVRLPAVSLRSHGPGTEGGCSCSCQAASADCVWLSALPCTGLPGLGAACRCSRSSCRTWTGSDGMAVPGVCGLCWTRRGLERCHAVDVGGPHLSGAGAGAGAALVCASRPGNALSLCCGLTAPRFGYMPLGHGIGCGVLCLPRCV